MTIDCFQDAIGVTNVTYLRNAIWGICCDNGERVMAGDKKKTLLLSMLQTDTI